MKFKVIELFAGIGSQSKSLKNIGIDYEIVATSDWDIFANISYTSVHYYNKLISKLNQWDKEFKSIGERERERERERVENVLSKFTLSRDGKYPIKNFNNFNLRTLYALEQSLKISNNFSDIKNIKGKELPEHNIITYSFPCQDLSLQGSQKGLNEGKASSMLWEVERILRELKEENRLPKYLLMENVKSLFSNKYQEGFNKWVKTLEEFGYTNHKFVLNAKYFDIPQNRERAFMFSELHQNKFQIPSNNKITNKTIGDILEKDYVSWQQTKGEVIDWNPIKNKNGLAKTKIEGYTTFQSETAVFSKESIAPTITATGALNRIKVIEKEGTLRMLTSKEQWQLMGFEKSDWEKVNSLNIVPESNLKKQAGNSIVVSVLEAIFKEIK
ncbi:MAG: cytosine-specific methyltransferase [Candidatus Tyloplasma litorale]|nr:MAG: cytosine-specific methyltransferase [Mycoplasmatales bacterium]